MDERGLEFASGQPGDELRLAQQIRASEQKENIFLTAYSRSLPAQTFVIWNFGSGSAWSRSQFDSTELSITFFSINLAFPQRKIFFSTPILGQNEVDLGLR